MTFSTAGKISSEKTHIIRASAYFMSWVFAQSDFFCLSDNIIQQKESKLGRLLN